LDWCYIIIGTELDK